MTSRQEVPLVGSEKPDETGGFAGQWDHQATVDWLATQPGLLGGHEGEWVASAGRQIIAYGTELAEVMESARAAVVDDPLLVPVPPAGFLAA